MVMRWAIDRLIEGVRWGMGFMRGFVGTRELSTHELLPDFNVVH